MRKFSKGYPIERIIDANINRVKEGLRVCEEIARFILENRSLTRELKGIRHKISFFLKDLASKKILLQKRDSAGDIGKKIYLDELKRRDIADIFFANIQRVKESLRVLEEFSKLTNTVWAVKFKKLRYQTYEIERKFALSCANLLHHR